MNAVSFLIDTIHVHIKNEEQHNGDKEKNGSKSFYFLCCVMDKLISDFWNDI